MSAMGHLQTFGGSKRTSVPLSKADTKVTADFRALSGSDQTPLRSKLSWCLSSPTFECVGERADLAISQQPGNFRDWQFAFGKVIPCQGGPQLVQDVRERHALGTELARQRSRAHA